MYVYLIQNFENGKVYVGQHIGHDLEHYFLHRHIRPALRGRGKRRLICKAIRKYGPESFSIAPIIECGTKEELDLWEKTFIKLFDSTNLSLGYNLTAGGEGTIGFKPTAETLLKLSNIRKGKKPSALCIESLIERNRRGPTEQARKHMRLAAIRRFASPAARLQRSKSAKEAWARNREKHVNC